MPIQGWKWLEDEWLVDMGGLGQACIDSEGWSYAVDFPWLHQPPNPGAGRFKRVCHLPCPVKGSMTGQLSS